MMSAFQAWKTTSNSLVTPHLLNTGGILMIFFFLLKRVLTYPKGSCLERQTPLVWKSKRHTPEEGGRAGLHSHSQNYRWLPKSKTT